MIGYPDTGGGGVGGHVDLPKLPSGDRTDHSACATHNGERRAALVVEQEALANPSLIRSGNIDLSARSCAIHIHDARGRVISQIIGRIGLDRPSEDNVRAS